MNRFKPRIRKLKLVQRWSGAEWQASLNEHHSLDETPAKAYGRLKAFMIERGTWPNS